MAFSFKLCVGRPPGADRHAIPSPTDIILYQPTEAMQMSEVWARLNRETFQRRDKDGGRGIVK